MENKIILSMGSMYGKYFAYRFIAICTAAILFAIGAPMIYAVIRYDYTDELSVWLLGVLACWFGADVIGIAYGNHLRCRKSLNTNLEVTSNEIRGMVNSMRFAVRVEEVVSTVIQVCSVDCDSNGKPKNMNPGLLSKFYASANKYLCIYTNTGRTIYIDGLTSPETAKNAIDALIMRNMANRKGDI